MALRNSRRLLRLVNQILDVAKLEAGQMKLRARRQDLVTFARGVAAAFGQIAEQNHIDFDVVAPPTRRRLVRRGCAREGVRQPALERLQVHAGRRAHRAARRDEGQRRAGQSHRQRDRGFRPSICRTSSSGSIRSTNRARARSRAPALASRSPRSWSSCTEGPSPSKVPRGATFTVTLPLGRAHLRDDQIVARPKARWHRTDELEVDDAIVGNGETETRVPTESADVTTLLIVDDSADMRAYVRSHFESRYRVVEAGDGAEGIERAKSLLPDLVISDVMMPGIDGNVLCRTLKSDPETDFIPIILLTALASTDDRVAGLVRRRGRLSRQAVRDARARRARREPHHDSAAPSRAVRGRGLWSFPRHRDSPRWDRRTRRSSIGCTRRSRRISTESEFGVAELAEHVFLDRSHLFRRTRELVGETPSDLIRRLRLERAAQLLKEGAGNVAEVAYAVGFQSLSHFSRSFREAHGVSPSEYRGGSFRAEARRAGVEESPFSRKRD